jgi:hypothetical protein
MCRFKTEVVRHLVLQGFDLGRKKFDHSATFGADHMIVVLMIVMVFIVGLVVAESDLTREARLGQKLKCPVNGRMSDSGVLALNEMVKIFAGQVSFRAQKRFENDIALCSATKSGFLNVFQKDLFLLSEFLNAFWHFR